MVTKLRSGRSISNQSTQLPSQGSDTSFYTSQGSPPPELQQRSRSRSTPQSSNSSKSDTDTNLDVRLTSPPRRTRPIAPLRTYEKGLPKHLLKEIIQDIVAVGGFNSHRYNLADLRNANRDSYGNIAVRKQVENQVYHWKNFNQEQWTSLLDEYGLLQTPYASASAKPVKATSESEVVFASPVSASTKTKSKKQQLHQHFSSPSLSSNSDRTMSSMSWKMPPQMLAKYESGDYSTFGIGRQSDLARSFTHSHINSFSCTAEIDVNPHHPEQNLHVYVYPFSDAMHDGNTKVHDGFEIAIRGGADPQDFKNKKYKAFLPEEHGNEVFLLLPAIESSELYRGDEYYEMEQKKNRSCHRLEMARRTNRCEIADDPSRQTKLVLLRFPAKQDKYGKMVPEELTNERYSPGRGGQIKAWLTPIFVDYTAKSAGGVQAVDQLKCRLAFKIAICGERGVEHKAELLDADEEELANLVQGMDVN